MHARRGFEKAHQAGDSRATIILGLIQKLYAVERQADQDTVDEAERLKRRLRDSAPVYEEIFELLDQWAPQVPPKTPLGKAIGYARNRRVQLSRFLEDARLGLDKGYASHCTSLARLGATSEKRRRFDSLLPCFFAGSLSPECSYRHSFLSL